MISYPHFMCGENDEGSVFYVMKIGVIVEEILENERCKVSAFFLITWCDTSMFQIAFLF